MFSAPSISILCLRTYDEEQKMNAKTEKTFWKTVRIEEERIKKKFSAYDNSIVVVGIEIYISRVYDFTRAL